MGGQKTLSTVFYISATGHIGGQWPLFHEFRRTQRLNLLSWPLGAVLAELIKTYPELKITALVRNPSHIEAVRNLGIEVVRGNFSDTDLTSSHVRAADITVNSGDSHSAVLNEVILAGQKARVIDDGKPQPSFSIRVG